MDDIKQARIRAAAQKLMAGHDELMDLLPEKKSKKASDAYELLEDALDSLEECISCLSELLEE